jgi:tetratricopeptide (TPR) repeat protein
LALARALERHAAAPADPDIYREICNRLVVLKRMDAVADWAQRALVAAPEDADLAILAGGALSVIGEHAEAAAFWRRHARLFADLGFFKVNLGFALMMAGELREATALLGEAASSEGPNRKWAEQFFGEAKLRAGDPAGFGHWLARNATGDSLSVRPVDIPEWTPGAPLSGRRVLITHQLGFGDQLLLGSCLSDWLSAGAEIALCCDPEIAGVVRASWPRCTVLEGPSPKGWAEPTPVWLQAALAGWAPDYWISLLHLPLLVQTSGRRPYFASYARAPEEARRVAVQWAKARRLALPGQALVGFFWDAQNHHFPQIYEPRMIWWSLQRSLSPDEAARLTADPRLSGKVTFFSLHHPKTPGGMHAPPGVESYGPGIEDFSQTAAVIEQLDVVVAVDSSVANLSAMIGRPTLVLASAARDWRWTTPEGVNSWMARVSVFAQRKPRDWREPIESVIQALTAIGDEAAKTA